jgi:hypothetical protein
MTFINCVISDCKLQYVGQSNNFNQRLGTYKRNISQKIGDTSLENHMRKIHKDHEDPISLLKIHPIRKYDPKTHSSNNLKAHETVWIKRLKTKEFGLNKRIEKTECFCIDYEREKELLNKNVEEKSDCNSTPQRRNPRRSCKSLKK